MGTMNDHADGSIYRLGKAHYEFLRLWPGAVQENDPDALLAGNRLAPIPFRNHATFVRTAGDRAARLIGKVRAFYADLEALPAFQLDPDTAPDDFAKLLVAAGFRKQVEEAWMVFDSAHSGHARANPAVEVSRFGANGPEQAIQAYIDCYNVSFRTPAQATAGFGESFRGVVAHPAGIHYLGQVEGEPAGSMSLFAKAGLGCVYNVATFPRFRGQDVATTLLLHLIADAERLHVHSLFLQAVHHGPAQPLYQRVGFRTDFVREWYLPDAPGGIWS